MVVVGPGIWREEVTDLLGNHVEDYLYFAASIFWRAGARIWDPTWKPFSLGDRYQEEFRLYLLGQAGWPTNARLVVHVSTDDRVDFTVLPVSAKIATAHRYKFYIPGMMFILHVGATVPRERDGGALNSRGGHFMWLSPLQNDSLYKGFISVGIQAMRNPRTLRPLGR
jgi:hypothetical protein